MTVWKISTYHRKSCVERAYFVHPDYSEPLIVEEGYRSCEYWMETQDGKPPHLTFEEVPGGDGKRDSLNLNACCSNNIVDSWLDGMFDGWAIDFEFPSDMPEEAKERLQSLLEDEGSLVLDSEGWLLSDTEIWVWGPLLIEADENDYRWIVVANENGEMVEYRDEESDLIS